MFGSQLYWNFPVYTNRGSMESYDTRNMYKSEGFLLGPSDSECGSGFHYPVHPNALPLQVACDEITKSRSSYSLHSGILVRTAKTEFNVELTDTVCPSFQSSV